MFPWKNIKALNILCHSYKKICIEKIIQNCASLRSVRDLRNLKKILSEVTKFVRKSVIEMVQINSLAKNHNYVIYTLSTIMLITRFQIIYAKYNFSNKFRAKYRC